MKTSTETGLACGEGFERTTLNGATMGTRYSAVFYPPPNTDLGALAEDLFGAVDRVDQQMSTWKPSSDLNRLNAAASGEPVPLPAELLRVLAAALDFEKRTGGAFDVAIGDLVEAWGFGKCGDQPDRDRIRALGLQARVPAGRALTLDAHKMVARKSAPVSVDLNGIAKGFAVDEMGRVLSEHRIDAWLAGIDGDMRGKGRKPDGSAWAVAHERPDRFVRDAMGVIELTDLAVATSGHYRHWREYEGQVVSHTIDPRTGQPLANGLASVTVIAPSCMAADAWATAYMVLGPEVGLKTAKRDGMQVIFVLDNGGVISTL